MAFVSINTMNPKGNVNAEIKRYKIDYPVFYGRGQKINRNFKVKVLPRLILINAQGKVDRDVQFMKADQLRVEIERLLTEAGDSLQIGKPDTATKTEDRPLNEE